jgi:MFS family permease
MREIGIHKHLFKATPLVLGRFFSTCGDQIIEILVIWIAWQATHSSFVTSLAAFSQRAPFWLLGFFNAGLTDRRNPLNLLLSASLLAAFFALIATGIALWNNQSLLIIGLAFLIGCARSFEAPALSAMVPVLMPASHAHQANNLLDNAKRTARIIAPFLIGTLNDGQSFLCLVAVASCYAAMAFCAVILKRFVSIPKIEIVTSTRSPFTAMEDIIKTRTVGALLFSSMIYAFFHGASYFAFLPRLTLANDQADVTHYAHLISIIAIGGLCGNGLILFFQSMRADMMVTLGMIGAGIGFGLMGIASENARLFLAFALGLSLPLQDVFIISLIQTHAKSDLVARSHALWRLGCELTIGLGMLAGGFMAGHVSIAGLLLAAGTGMILAGLGLLQFLRVSP